MEELEVIRNSGQDGRGRRESSVALANLEDSAAAGPAAVIQPATVHHQQVEEIEGAAGLGLSPADKMDACHSIFHERAISECGIGRFHWMLLAACGMGVAADTCELLVLGFVLPSAEVDFCISEMEKRVLGVVTYTGLATGALLWGCTADRVGRRRTLLTALTLASIFDLMAALMPTFGTFLTARLFGGIGLGGSLPILIAFYSEFIPRPSRVKWLSALLTCWAIGGIYVALMAWAILPKTGLMVVLDGQQHFSAWHIFMIVCAIPTPLAVIGLLALPESPRILLHIGHEREALVIYQRIFQQNHPKLTVDEYKVSEADLPSSSGGSQRHQQQHHLAADNRSSSCSPNGIGALSSSSPTGVRACNRSGARQKSILSVLSYTLVNFSTLIAKIFAANQRRATLPLLATWIIASFGYYGLSLWFPDYVKFLKGRDFEMGATTLTEASFTDVRFNSSIENMVYVNSHFTRVRFEGLILNHVLFDSCTFDKVSFHRIKSSRSFFRNSTLLRSSFVDTDFFPYRFQDCRMEETTFNGMDAFCPLDFDYNIFIGDVFLEQLVGEISLIPGLILAALLMDRFGRVRLIGVSFFICSLLALTLLAVRSPEAVIGVESAFNAVFAIGFVSLTVASTETCPTSIRATGWGLINTLSRGAGLAGLFIYDAMVNIPLVASCFATSGIMLLAAVLSLFIIETRHKLL